VIIKLKLIGIHCEACIFGIQNYLQNLEKINKIEIKNDEALIDSDLEPSEIIENIRNIGLALLLL
jgi:copper chaperone CopZ